MSAANASIKFAVQDKVDLKSYHLSSVIEFENGISNLFEHNSSHPYDIEVRQRLKGKIYWQACYTHKDPEVAGAMFCYFLNSEDLALLAAYRLK